MIRRGEANELFVFAQALVGLLEPAPDAAEQLVAVGVLGGDLDAQVELTLGRRVLLVFGEPAGLFQVGGRQIDRRRLGRRFDRDCPAATRAALEMVKDGKHPEFTGKRVWLESGQKTRDNGALVRCTPIGVFFLWDQAARINATLEDAQISHFSPQCQLASVILNAVITAAITCPKEKLDKVDALKAIEAELSIAAAQLGRQLPDWVLQVKDASDWLREDIKASQDPDPMLYGPELHLHLNESWVRVTLRLALWELWHAPTFEAALIDVINRGGDADANAAVTGALFGAVHGATAIPERWSQDVLEVNGQGPLFSKYHPRELMTLVQNLPERPVKVAPGAVKK